jgi:two-component system sensor kinase FixL
LILNGDSPQAPNGARLKQNPIQDLFTLRFLHTSRTAVLSSAGLFIFVLALVDWYFEENISFGFLYLFPMLMVGSWLSPAQIAAVALLCTGLTEAFDPFPWVMPVGLSRLVLSFVAFFGTGLYGFQSARGRRLADEQMGQMTREAELRRKTEEQMNFLISSSPASIFTLDASGRVQLANRAAHQLLAVESGKLEGKAIGQFFPALANVPAAREAPFFHTEMECRARRQDGDVFLAHIFFSTYQTMSGPRLAAVVFDASEELRDRAEFSLRQILTGSRILVGALCHEIRNICGAIAMVHSKLTRDGQFAGNEDFRALGTLVEGLEQMAGLELRQTAKPWVENIDVRSVLEELRIVIEPSLHDSGIVVTWVTPEILPRIRAEHQSLLQAFLNIAKNAQRALEDVDTKEFTVRVSAESNAVVVRFVDTGGGVRNPAQLFAPFQPGAQATGLGLYLSKTFVRNFGGDIDYEQISGGSCFAVTLALAESETAASSVADSAGTST